MIGPEGITKTLEIPDTIFGDIEINEPVLIDLIQSPAVQRLKGINQYGPPPQWYESQFGNFSRYEHSVGTMVLLHKLDASTEEKAAGLLHDVAHTAFSHVGDWVFGDAAGEAYADRFHEQYITNSGILDILEQHGLESRAAFDIKDFSLLEQPAPALCADRLDYALREAAGWLDPELPNAVMGSLTVEDGRMVLSETVTARRLATTFLELQEKHWASGPAIIRFELLSRALKRALDRQIIDVDDLYQTDNHLAAMLEAASDSQVQQILNWLSIDIPLRQVEEGSYDLVLRKKFRHIDPLVMVGIVPYKLSEIDNNFGQELAAARLRNQAGIKVKILEPELLQILKN